MSGTKEIITSFENRQEFFDLLNVNPGLIIIKFGATWCKPCKIIKPIIDSFFLSSPENVICCDVDVDESFDLYSLMKFKKITNGIPVVLVYIKGNNTIIPNSQVTGTNPVELDNFFKECGNLQALLVKNKV
jgi:thiol-disulfide isomerase/thioredoxin